MIEKYDIVVVGSGLGGLLCGAFLAKEGKRVCVLEKHYQIGGNLQVFRRKGCSFSVGMHYTGCLDKGQILHKVFNYLGIHKHLEIKKLDENAYEKIIIGEKEYSYSMGIDNFRQNLIKYFPNEKEAIEKYTAKLDQIWESSDLLNLRISTRSDLPRFEKFNENAYSYINSITSNKDLQALLAATNFLYAGIKEKTPLYIHANTNHSFIKSAWRIAEQGAKIAGLLKRIIEENNGVVHTKKEISEFEFEGSKIKNAVTTTGEKYNADLFISNIHPLGTIHLAGPQKFRESYVDRIKKLDNSISAFALYIVLKKKHLKHINSNIYYSIDNNVWDNYNYNGENWPRSYLMYTTEDKTYHDYAESVTILTMMKFEDVKKWEHTNLMERGKDYQEFKELKTKRVLDLVACKFPELINSIDTVYSATPLTFRDYTGTYEGSMYGIIKDCNDPMKTFLSPKTGISNLFLTGQNIGLNGMLGVVMSSLQTCSTIININELIEKIKANAETLL